jgi:hypothetical protein
VSAPNGDANATAAAVDARGESVVAFTEWRGREQSLRVATRAEDRWRVVTLDRRPAPIWSPHVLITPDGTTIVAWIDGTDPTRTIRVAARKRGGVWQRPVTLENGNGFGNFLVSTGRGDRVVVAWHSAVANEWRVRVATHERGAWGAVATLARSLDMLDHIAITGRDATLVRWLERGLGRGPVERLEASRSRSHWVVVSRRRLGSVYG